MRKKMSYDGYAIEVAVAADQRVRRKGVTKIWLWNHARGIGDEDRPAEQLTHEALMLELERQGVTAYVVMAIYQDVTGALGLQPAMLLPGARAVGWSIVPKATAEMAKDRYARTAWTRNVAMYELAEYEEQLRQTMFMFRIYRDEAPYRVLFESAPMVGTTAAIEQAYAMIEGSRASPWKRWVNRLLGKGTPQMLLSA